MVETEREQLVSSPSAKTPSPRKRSIRLVLPSAIHHNAFPSSPATPSAVFNFDIPNSPGYGIRARTPRTPVIRTPLANGNITPLHKKSSQFTFENHGKPGLRSISEVEFVETPTSIFNFEFPLDQPSVTVVATVETDENGNEGTDGISVITSEPCPKTDWHNIILIAFVNFLVRMQFTVYFASLWPFLQEVDETATPTFLAYMGAVYSIGVAFSAPLFGYWSNKIGQIRRPALVSLWLMLISNILYLTIDYFPTNRKYVMMFARFNVGIAAGAASILNTYWTYASQLKDRSTAAAIADGAFSLGTAFGPLFQLIFSPFGYPGVRFHFLSINMYTLPAMVGIIMVVIAMIILAFYFHEMDISQLNSHTTKRDSVESEYSFVLPTYDILAIGICIMLKCMQMFIYANIETIGSPFTEWMFSLTRSETTQFNSSLVTVSGLVGFAFLLCYVWTKVGKKLDNRIGLHIGYSICIMFIICTYPWWFYNETIESAGCKYWWCAKTAKINQYVYSIAYVTLFGIGFPLINVHLAALYSQVLGPRRQGTMHGMNTLISSLSRIAGPVIVTSLFEAQGPRLIWIVQLLVVLSAMVPTIVFYNRMVPLKTLQEMKTGEKLKHKGGVVYRF